MTEELISILVVDDEDTVREFIRDALTAFRFTVHVAATAGNALELLAVNWIDLVFCDIQLPDRSGVDLAKQIRRKNPDLPIIMITGSADADNAIQSLQLGAADFLEKPFSVRRLLDCVRSVLDREAQRKAALQQSEHERLALRSLFDKCLSPLVVEQLLRTPEQLRLQGERRIATVLFGDLRGFSTVSGEIDPTETVKLLNAYLAAVVDIIDQYGGMLEKFQGDGVMAVFGVPVSKTAPALRAVLAALDMQKAVGQIASPYFGGAGLPMGIGINTGEVIAGNIGCERRFEYTVIGDPVNVAKRLESQAGSQQILISDTTYDEVREYVDTQDIGELHVGGTRKSVNTFNVVGIKEGVPLPFDPQTDA